MYMAFLLVFGWSRLGIANFSSYPPIFWSFGYERQVLLGKKKNHNVSVPVSSSGLEGSEILCPGYMGANKKTRETHYHVLPQILSSLGSPPSRVFLCLLIILCSGLFHWAKGERPLFHGQNQKSSDNVLLNCKVQHKCKKLFSRLNPRNNDLDKCIEEKLCYFKEQALFFSLEALFSS